MDSEFLCLQSTDFASRIFSFRKTPRGWSQAPTGLCAQTGFASFNGEIKKALGIPGLFITKIVVRDLGLLLATEATCYCTDSKQTENRHRGRLGNFAVQPNVVDQATIIGA